MTFGEANEHSFMHKVGCSQDEAFRIMDLALEAGINFWDTANVYGQEGLTETIVGRWISSRKRRDEVVLATKFRFQMLGGPNGSGASRVHIRRAIEDSLRRLACEYVDLYQIHMQDELTPEEELLRTLDDLVREGKVRYVGCSNYTAHRLVDSVWTAKSQRLEPFVTAQMQYSLLERSIEREHIPACQRHGLGVLAWSPLAGGMLSGRYTQGQPAPEGSRLSQWKDNFARRDSPHNWKVVKCLTDLAEEHGVSPSALALAWLLERPAVSSVIVGVRSVEQLEANLAALDLEVPESVFQRLSSESAPDWGYPYNFIQRICGQW